MPYVKYFLSVLVWQFLNPFGIWQSILQNGGQVIAILRSRLSPATAPDIPMALPFTGYWTVVNGGVEESTSHSWDVLAQRYAYDFVLSGEDGERHWGDGKKPHQYLGFGQDVLAPADGVVIMAQNNIRDYGHAGTGSIDTLTRDFRGNFVIIRHAERVFSFIAHLKKGSCRVALGDFVTRGQVIGQCGNSGHSTEPHIHFHIQDHPNFYLGVGLPILFGNIEINFDDGEEPQTIRRGYISKGCRVRNLSHSVGSQDEEFTPSLKMRLRPGRWLSVLTSLLNVAGLIVWLVLAYLWLIRPLITAATLLIGGD